MGPWRDLVGLPCGNHAVCLRKLGFTKSEIEAPAMKVARSAFFDLLDKEIVKFPNRIVLFLQFGNTLSKIDKNSRDVCEGHFFKHAGCRPTSKNNKTSSL